MNKRKRTLNGRRRHLESNPPVWFNTVNHKFLWEIVSIATVNKIFKTKKKKTSSRLILLVKNKWVSSPFFLLFWPTTKILYGASQILHKIKWATNSTQFHTQKWIVFKVHIINPNFMLLNSHFFLVFTVLAELFSHWISFWI